MDGYAIRFDERPGPWRLAGWECRDTGIAAATQGLASARVARPRAVPAVTSVQQDAEFFFLFVLAGAVTLHREEQESHRCAAGTALVLPAGMRYALAECTGDLEILEVAMCLIPPLMQVSSGAARPRW